jgi:hypothetical protein
LRFFKPRRSFSKTGFQSSNQFVFQELNLRGLEDPKGLHHLTLEVSENLEGFSLKTYAKNKIVIPALKTFGVSKTPKVFFFDRKIPKIISTFFKIL